MQTNKLLFSLYINLILLVITSQVQTTVFNFNDILFIEFCQTGLRAPGTYTLICSSQYGHYNVTKAALALSEHSKQPNQIIKFSVSPIILAGSPMMNFGAQLNITSPSIVGLEIKFFLAIICGHWYWRMMDIMHVQWNPGSAVDTEDNFVRTDIQTFPIFGSTIMDNTTDNVAIYSFTSSFHLQPQKDALFTSNHTRTLEFSLTASLNPTLKTIEVPLTAQPYVRIEKFSAFVLVINISEYNQANLWNWKLGYSSYSYSLTPGFILDLRTVQPLYGPSFHGKCIFGINKLSYQGIDFFAYQIGYTPIYATLVSFTQSTGAPVSLSGNAFCVGRGLRCMEHLGSHLDEYTLQCSDPSNCPLPAYSVWHSRTLCPRCADNVCYQCDVLTRKICYGCYGHLFSFLNTTTNKCQCNVNYMPVKFPTVPGQGLWGDQNQTLYYCKVNCSAAISKCIFGACTNETYCNNCDYGYIPYKIAEKVQKCIRCANILSNCVACSATNVCDLCTKNHYLVDYFDSLGVLNVTQCRPCREAVENCVECTQAGVCIQCVRPYDIGPSGKCDQCMPIYRNFSNMCMLYHGCISTTILEDQTEICIACIPGIHYYYDVSTSTCVCEKGYHETQDPQYWYVCEPQCGDGIPTFLTEKCDDKNKRNGDGCSSSCEIQQGYTCLPYEPSECVFIINFSLFEYQYAYRIVGQDKGLFYFKILPHDIRLQTLDWKQLITFNFSQSAVKQQELNFTYTYDSDQIEIQVPYREQLEDLFVESKLTLFPDIVSSNPSEFTLNFKLNGINAPLIFESILILKTQRMANILSLVFASVVLLQFYIGSYFGKMIGLETLQVIQTIYFARIAIVSEDSAFVNSLNNLKYTTVGYANPKLFYSDLKFAKNDVYTSQRGQLQSIGMHKFFLLNIDFFLVTILAVVTVYCRYFRRKTKIRSDYITTRLQQKKDKYTSFKRKAQWVYSHVFFPIVIMFNYVVFFTTISSELQLGTANQLVPLRTVEIFSFPFYSSTFYITIAVWSFEIFNSYDAFIKSRMTEQQKNMTPPSLIEKLQHDENSPDRPNFNPFYILVYLIFYLILQLAMVLSIFVDDFHFTLELISVLSLAYFGLIWKWNPYNQAIDIHNKFLRLNHGTVVFFSLSFMIIKWIKNLNQKIQVVLMYTNLSLIGLVVLGGFARIYYEHRYRVLGLEESKSADKKEKELKKLTGQQKRNKLLTNNKYLFEKQLQQIGKKYGVEYTFNIQNLGRPQRQTINQHQKQTLIMKIRDQLKYPKKKMSDHSNGDNLRMKMRDAGSLILEEPKLDEIKARMRKQYNQNLIQNKPPWARV